MRRRTVRGAALFACALVMLAVGCSPSAPRQPGRAAACRETPSVPSASVPAAVHDFDKAVRWYGADDLWVAKPALLDHTGERRDGYRAKYASVTLDARGRVTDRKGAPRVGAGRLDGPGSVNGGTGGLATVDGHRQWWPTVIAFPEAGCWKVTETLGSTQVGFTLRVGVR
ncbi:hypothetical protein [Streptomyces sp. NPDC001811]